MKPRYKYVVPSIRGNYHYWCGKVVADGVQYYTRCYPATDDGEKEAHEDAVKLKKKLSTRVYLDKLKPYMNDQIYNMLVDVLYNEKMKVKPDDELRSLICEIVCDKFRVSMTQLRSPCRKFNMVMARHCAVYLMRKHTKLSLVTIARTFARDHTTALHSMRYVEDRIDTELKETLTHLENKLIQKKYLS